MTLHPSELNYYLDLGIVEKVMGLINTGKEASVYLAVAGEKHFAIKIFKDRNCRSFRNRSDYFMQTIPENRREARALKNKTAFGRKTEESLWRSREVRMLNLLHGEGADVPEVVAVGENSFVMEYFGTPDQPAPRLADLRTALLHPQHVFERIIWNVSLFFQKGIIHGDLSPYNIRFFRVSCG